jgi:hypothetical protein
VSKLQALSDCSLIKVTSGFDSASGFESDLLWVHDVIKGIATRAALAENKQCMTRVWLPDQVSAASSHWSHAKHVVG